MSHNQNSIGCHVMCWIVAGLIGLIAMFMLYLLADFGFLQAFFSGAVVGAVLGVILSIFVCGGQSAAADLASDEKPAQRYAAKAAAKNAQRASVGADAQAQSAPVAPAASAAPATSTAVPLMSSGAQPSAPLAGEGDLASRKGSVLYEDGAAAEKKPAAEKAVAKKPAAKKAPAKKAPARKAAAKPAAKRPPVAADGQPQIYSSAPAGGSDDLKLISGVGPKLEQTLNDMGIYEFQQVAGWRKKEIAWVDDRLKFKGRIERDDWMSQAKILAKGGETEFSKRAKK